jgi:hypothetical protein
VDAGAVQSVFDPVGAKTAGLPDVFVEGHGGELGGDRRPFGVGQRSLEMGLDGGPVDVGDAGSEGIGQLGEQSVGVPAVGGDEGLDSPGAHDLPDWDDSVSGWGLAMVVRVHGRARVDDDCCWVLSAHRPSRRVAGAHTGRRRRFRPFGDTVGEEISGGAGTAAASDPGAWDPAALTTANADVISDWQADRRL